MIECFKAENVSVKHKSLCVLIPPAERRKGGGGVLTLKCAERSEVRQCTHRHAKTSQSRAQISFEHMEEAVELGS